MKKRIKMPCALTVAGSDSGGGAGVQADLKTFAAMGVHGVSAITCLTAQNPGMVSGVLPVSAKFVIQQLEAVVDSLQPRAAKTGMLLNRSVILEVAKFFRNHPGISLVVDPVMVATSGANLIKSDAIRALRKDLFPLAVLITPNIPEAEVLTGLRIGSPEAMRRAARHLHEDHGCAVLLKGGHLRGTSEAIDIFYDHKEELLLSSPRVKGVRTHGTGCTYAAAVTAGLAQDKSLRAAVEQAKGFMANAIAASRRVGGCWVLGWRGDGRAVGR